MKEQLTKREIKGKLSTEIAKLVIIEDMVDKRLSKWEEAEQRLDEALRKQSEQQEVVKYWKRRLNK